MKDIDWSLGGKLDWHTDIGAVLLEQACHGDFYDAMYCPALDEKVPLPKNMKIPFDQVPSLWRMIDNYHLSTVMLVKESRPREAYSVGEIFTEEALQ